MDHPEALSQNFAARSSVPAAAFPLGLFELASAALCGARRGRNTVQRLGEYGGMDLSDARL